MTKKILILFILIFSFSALSLEAQTRKKKKKSEVEIIEFEDDSPSRSARNKKNQKLSGMVLKTNPISNIFGWQFIELERPLLPYLSAEIGVGVTFQPVVTNDYLAIYSEILATTGGQENQWGEYDIFDPISDNSIRKYKAGIYGSIAGNIYYYDDVMDGNYISLKLRYSSRNNEVQRVQEGIVEQVRVETDWQDEYKRYTDIMIGWGYQELYSRISLGYHISAGYRLINSQRQDLGRLQDFTVVNGVYNDSSRRLRLEFGLRLGYQL